MRINSHQSYYNQPILTKHGLGHAFSLCCLACSDLGNLARYLGHCLVLRVHLTCTLDDALSLIDEGGRRGSSCVRSVVKGTAVAGHESHPINILQL